MKKIQMFFLIPLAMLVTTVYAQASTMNIYCPTQKVRTEIVTPLPNGWWQTPQVGSLVNVKVKRLAGKSTIYCNYWAYGRTVSVMKKVPLGYTCRVVGKHVRCSNRLILRPIPTLNGTWYGAAGTQSMTKLKIYKVGTRTKVHAWGKCHPRDCDWGLANAQVLSSSKIVVRWNKSFVRRRMVIQKVGVNRLKVRTFSHYIDGSRRPDRVKVEYMYR